MKGQITTMSKSLITAVLFVMMSATASIGQTTLFTYQGRFIDGGSPANGTYDMQFKLFDGATVGTGTQISSTITNGTVTVSNGVFTVQLDYGATAFPGADRFLEIGVRPAGSSSPYTVLAPRQQLTSAVYAIRARATTTADTATNATQLGGIPANQYVLTSDSRLTDPRPPTAGSSNYIQNTTSPQASSNFNISGNGTAGGTLSADVISAATQYNIAGSRFLSIAGTANTFAGIGTGFANAGDSNSFFGAAAGLANTTGNNNSFSGAFAGASNKQGNDNAFFGSNAGRNNTESSNSFFGSSAGTANTTGYSNSFFGSNAGQKNKSADNNSFLGANAGLNNVTGARNTFAGEGAGRNNITGSDNAFFGVNAGGVNTSANGNTFIGDNAAPGHVTGDFNTALGGNTSVADGVTNSTAIGANVAVTTSNTMMLGTSTVAVVVPGTLYVKTLGGGGLAPLCTDVAGRIAGCSSSLRYKKDFQPFTRGLALLSQLKPITFRWKANDMLDVGFGAEDIAAVEPLLVTHNAEGQIEGVKYDRITDVLVNAVKEQQAQIEAQKTEIASLKKLVCRNRSRATACR